MADIFDSEKRSQIMAKVKSSDTKPEVLVRKFLFSLGFRYRKNRQDLPGKPDIVLPKYKTVIFVHGCFWHGHKGCSAAALPKSRQDYWHQKIQKNAKRDSLRKRELKKLGWNVLIVWECDLKKIVSTENKKSQNFLKMIYSNFEVSRIKS